MSLRLDPRDPNFAALLNERLEELEDTIAAARNITTVVQNIKRLSGTQEGFKRIVDRIVETEVPGGTVTGFPGKTIDFDPSHDYLKALPVGTLVKAPTGIYSRALQTFDALHIEDVPYGYWKFDEASGTIEDHSGNGNDLTVTGSTYGEAALVNDGGSSMKFDANSDMAEVTGLGNTGLTKCSMEMWFKAENPDPVEDAVLFDIRDSGNSREFAIGLISGTLNVGAKDSTMNAGYVDVGIAGTNYFLGRVNILELKDEKVHHIVLTWDNSAGDTKVYIDGELVETFTANASGVIDCDSITIGRSHTTTTAELNGWVDNCAFYDNTVLTASQVYERYRRGSNPVSVEGSALYQAPIVATRDGIQNFRHTFYFGYRNADQTGLNAGVGVKNTITMNATEIDLGGNYTSPDYIVPEDGFYDLWQNIGLDTITAGTNTTIGFERSTNSGSTYTTIYGPLFQWRVTNTIDREPGGLWNFPLNAGDYIRPFAIAGSTFDLKGDGSGLYSTVMIRRVA